MNLAMTLITSFQSEWLKKKRSLASWMVIIGSVFTPAIMILIQVLRPKSWPAKYITPDFWEVYFRNCWEGMAILLLPMGIILSISLIAQLEYKNNTWKLLHATPQPLTTIFISKFGVILLMQVQLFIMFNVAIYLSAIIASSLVEAIPFPTEPFPLAYFARQSGYYFIDSLPILAIQYLLGLQFRNFLVSVGAGLVLMVTGITMISWEYSYIFPYNYMILHHVNKLPAVNIHAWAMGWFSLVMIASYILYLTKKEKG